MHDLDRTLRAYEPEIDEEVSDAGELEPEYDFEYGNGFELEASDFESPLEEQEEIDLAAELLAVSDEAELDQFLGKLFKRVGRGFKSVFRPLGKILRPIAKRLLPIAGGAVGTFFGGPVGGALGGKLGSFASNLFELELEGVIPEEQEMEVARRFVRLASTAAQQAAAAPISAPPAAVARTALVTAARAHAPGLLRTGMLGPAAGGASAGNGGGRARSGRWIRRGNRIILLGV